MTKHQVIDRLRQGPFGLGTADLGGLYAPLTDHDAAAVLTTAWQAGVRYFDTAPHYGAGLSEQRLGRFLGTQPRGEYVVSTKVGRILVPGDARPGDEGFYTDTGLVRVFDYSRDGVLRALQDSVRRTGIDHFDIVFIHDPDDHWPQAVDEAYPTLAGLRDEGVVDAIGVGMNQWQMPARFVRETDIDVVMLAGRHTLLDRGAEVELLPLCHERGVAVVAVGVFNSGVLADPRPGAHYNYREASAEVLDRAVRMQRLCQKYGVPLAAAALQFPLRHQAVTAIVVGARRSEHVTANIELARHHIPDDLWAALDELRTSSG